MPYYVLITKSEDQWIDDLVEGDPICMEIRSPENLCIVHKRIKAFRISTVCQTKPWERAWCVQMDQKSLEWTLMAYKWKSGWQMG